MENVVFLASKAVFFCYLENPPDISEMWELEKEF